MANENMIQKHVDNFLAKIAGETPIDDNPRNSTEFWLNEIAESGGSSKIYLHNIHISNVNPSSSPTGVTTLGVIHVVILTDNSEPFTIATLSSFLNNNGHNSLANMYNSLGVEMSTASPDYGTVAYNIGIWSSNGTSLTGRFLQYSGGSGSLSGTNFGLSGYAVYDDVS